MNEVVWVYESEEEVNISELTEQAAAGLSDARMYNSRAAGQNVRPQANVEAQKGQLAALISIAASLQVIASRLAK